MISPACQNNALTNCSFRFSILLIVSTDLGAIGTELVLLLRAAQSHGERGRRHDALVPQVGRGQRAAAHQSVPAPADGRGGCRRRGAGRRRMGIRAGLFAHRRPRDRVRHD